MKNKFKYKKASVTVESTIIMPFVCILFFIFIAIIQIIIGKMEIKYILTESLYTIYNDFDYYENANEDEIESIFFRYLENTEYKNIENSYVSKIIIISNVNFENILISKNKIDDSSIIDIKINYNIRPLILNKIFTHFNINERVYLDFENDGKKYKYIWNENHIKRGIEIQYLFGKNVLKPVKGEFFRFDISNGQAIEMRTIDPTLKSYQKKGAVTSSVKKDILKFSKYTDYINIITNEGDIVKYEIKSKKFLIVIPENTINDFLQNEINNLISLSKKNDIIFELVEYGIKY